MALDRLDESVPRSAFAKEAPKPPVWADPYWRGLAAQVAVVLGLVLFIWYIVDNTRENLARLRIASGFGFVNNTAGFDIGFALFPYSATSTYGDALLVGFLNTLLVAGLGIVFATIIGFVMGILRLSGNWLVARLATVYVETLRNIPLLLQLLFWYTAVLSPLPRPADSLTLFDVIFLNNRGLTMPRPILGEGAGMVILLALVVGIVGAWALGRWAKARLFRTGQPFPSIIVGACLIVGLPLLAFLVQGAPLTFEYAEETRFALRGGVNVVPELVALLLGLSLYTAAFIAEIVRSGIMAVNKGQWEASEALGLERGPTLRLVVIPQALRVIIPPLTSQYLNLTKNSSLAVAIAYPDLVAIGGTVLNQTGQAIEIVLVWMVVYVTLSLTTSLLMNWYNARKALVER